MEMNATKIEGQIVEEPFVGRLLGYGTVRIKGTGASLERIYHVANPLGLRSAVADICEQQVLPI
jgi:hypothetical protein